MSVFTDFRDKIEAGLTGMIPTNPANNALPASSNAPVKAGTAGAISTFTSSPYFVPGIIIVILAIVFFGVKKG